MNTWSFMLYQGIHLRTWDLRPWDVHIAPKREVKEKEGGVDLINQNVVCTPDSIHVIGFIQ